VFAVLVLVARAGPGSSLNCLLLLGAAFAITAFSDSLYVYLAQVGDYSTGSYIDIGWLAGYNLVTLSALLCIGPGPHPDPWPKDEEQPASFWQSVAIYAAVLPLGAVLLSETQHFLTVSALGVAALMFFRQLITIHENVALNRELAGLTAALELKVKEQRLRLLGSSAPDSSDTQ